MCSPLHEEEELLEVVTGTLDQGDFIIIIIIIIIIIGYGCLLSQAFSSWYFS